MNEQYKKALEQKISDCMKEYDLNEDDVRFGGQGQIKGYVMGLQTALKLFEQAGVNKVVQVTESITTKEEPRVTRRVSSRRVRNND